MFIGEQILSCASVSQVLQLVRKNALIMEEILSLRDALDVADATAAGSAAASSNAGVPSSSLAQHSHHSRHQRSNSSTLADAGSSILSHTPYSRHNSKQPPHQSSSSVREGHLESGSGFLQGLIGPDGSRPSGSTAQASSDHGHISNPDSDSAGLLVDPAASAADVQSRNSLNRQLSGDNHPGSPFTRGSSQMPPHRGANHSQSQIQQQQQQSTLSHAGSDLSLRWQDPEEAAAAAAVAAAEALRVRALEREMSDLEREVALREEMEGALKERVRDLERAADRQLKGGP